MNPIKDRTDPAKKGKGHAGLNPSAAPRQEKRDIQPTFVYGNGLDHKA